MKKNRVAAMRWACRLAREKGLVLDGFKPVEKTLQAVIDEGPEWTAHAIREPGKMARLWRPTATRVEEAAACSDCHREFGDEMFYLRIW